MIAASRKHLPGGLKFRKDYSVKPDPTWLAAQSAHTQARAGMTYARSREEAPGHVESARSEFRALSRAWHAFLGFGVYLGPRDLGMKGCLKDSPISARNIPTSACQKQPYSQEGGVEEQENRDRLSRVEHAATAESIEAEIQKRVQQELLLRDQNYLNIPKGS
ncbi:hypothetical protein O988_01236 [Pseudogymnoascus sp. VKM F-3808]|nr:hypothetical protein O988_01236 [Pseudogymnoascus sp. VKM F-3808]